MIETMLTTVDNPYNPFVNYDEWFNWDFVAGYNTCSRLARVCASSFELSKVEQEEAFMEAALDILDNDETGKFSLITRNEKTPLESN